MTVKDSIRAVGERWRTVVIAISIGTLAAAATWYFRPSEFTAPLTLYVSAQPAYTNQTVLQSTQLSPPLEWSTRMTSYVELLQSTRVSEGVIEQLRLPESPEDVSSQIKADSATDSVVINVAVTDSSPGRAAQIANAVAAVFSNLVDELERPRSPDGVPPIAVRVVEPASVPAEPSSLGLPVMLALGWLSGMAVGIGIAVARHASSRSETAPVSVPNPMLTSANSNVDRWALPNQGPGGAGAHSSPNTRAGHQAGHSIDSTRPDP